MFITLEGPEGSGKTSHIPGMAEAIRQAGYDVIVTREPGGTPIGDDIRNTILNLKNTEMHPTTEILLFQASRAQLVNQIILPALAEGKVVLCDRYADSTMAYQGFARGMDIETLDAVNNFAIYGRKPDLTILLDLDIEAGFKRLEKRYSDSGESHDRFEREARDFHHRVRDGYHKLVAREPNRFCVIDADQSIDELSGTIWASVKELLLK